MIKYIFALLLPISASAKMIKVAVIDTGYTNFIGKDDLPMCEGLHADFTEDKIFMKEPPSDKNLSMHGTNIASLIDKNIDSSKKDKYCLIIINYFSKNGKVDSNNSYLSISYAINIGADIINYSGGGFGEIPEETKAVKRALDRGIIFVAAAGNEGKDLSISKFYPAMADPRVIVVGNVDEKRNRLPSSNFGSDVDVWEMGNKVNAGGVTLTGTSQSTAIVTGKIIDKLITEAHRDVIQRMRNTANTRGE